MYTGFRKAYQIQFSAEYYVGALDLYRFRLTEDGGPRWADVNMVVDLG